MSTILPPAIGVLSQANWNSTNGLADRTLVSIHLREPTRSLKQIFQIPVPTNAVSTCPGCTVQARKLCPALLPGQPLPLDTCQVPKARVRPPSSQRIPRRTLTNGLPCSGQSNRRRPTSHLSGGFPSFRSRGQTPSKWAIHRYRHFAGSQEVWLRNEKMRQGEGLLFATFPEHPRIPSRASLPGACLANQAGGSAARVPLRGSPDLQGQQASIISMVKIFMSLSGHPCGIRCTGVCPR